MIESGGLSIEPWAVAEPTLRLDLLTETESIFALSNGHIGLRGNLDELARKPPTRGMDDHRAEALEFFKTFPDQHLDNRPYKTLFGSGDWTCSIAHFTGTMKGPMQGPDGKEIPPTGKSFEVDF